MKIEVDNIEVIFKKNREWIEDTQIWEATIFYHQYELDFEIEERLVSNNYSGELSIDQRLVSSFVKHVLDNLDSIQSKGSLVLTELHKQVFKEDELLRTKGYFKAGGIELKSAGNRLGDSPTFIPYFKYDVYYFLESEICLMDPYHSYYGHFSNHNGLTMIGVSRIG